MRIRDIMSKSVVSVAPEENAGMARERLRVGEIDHLVVIQAKRVVGVLSGRDLEGAPDEASVEALMSRDIATIEPGATLRHAAGIMRGRAVGSLPVIEDGKLVGIVTTSDLLTALAKGGTHPTPTPDRMTLRRRGPRKRAAHV